MLEPCKYYYALMARVTDVIALLFSPSRCELCVLPMSRDSKQHKSAVHAQLAIAQPWYMFLLPIATCARSNGAIFASGEGSKSTPPPPYPGARNVRCYVCLLAGHLAGHMEDSRTPACLAPTCIAPTYICYDIDLRCYLLWHIMAM